MFKSVLLPSLLAAAALSVDAGSLKTRPPWSRFPQAPSELGHVYPEHVLHKRQLPPNITAQQTVMSPNGIPVRFKNTTGKVCETTPGVESFAGYVDLAEDKHSFFYFFAARNNPETAPITLWLNGGPGSDSMIGLFEELGPCNISEDLTSHVNPYSWTEYSNFIFLSQPYGVGFSYQGREAGSIDDLTGDFIPASEGEVTGRWPTINQTLIETTEEAAVAAWQAIQVIIATAPSIDNSIESKQFNLATESYGGHYGPAFYNYFYQQNEAIKNGSTNGTKLEMNTLTIINGIIDEAVQAPYYPLFANNNTYGIKALNDTVFNYAEFALNFDNGCLAQVELCRATNKTSLSEQALCSEAASMCRDNVEGVYYSYGGRGVYDIRHPYDDPTPADYFVDFLNQAEIQSDLGVDVNYTTANTEVYFAFQQTGDFVYDNFMEDLEQILDYGVRVSLIYGDADYICNWFGGEAVSLAVNYTHADQFRAAGYAPMTVNGTQYGETREHGNFSFTRVYEAGHEVPYYQPVAALALFQRAIQGLSAADGGQLTATTSTNGSASATHTAPFVPLPSSSDMSVSGGASTNSPTAMSSAAVNTTMPELNRYKYKVWW